MARDPAIDLALAYARGAERAVYEDFFELDRRLADAVRHASEPIIAQLKLAWWRDRFAQDRSQWPTGEPLLARLAAWDADLAQLGRLVDGWEELAAADQLTPQGIAAFAGCRAQGWAVAATALGAASPDALDNAGMRWALADLAQHCGDPAEAQLVYQVAGDLGCAGARPSRLPRPLRPFAILGTLGARALSGKRAMMSTGGDFLVAVRTGMLGR